MAPPSESSSVTARDGVYPIISPEPHFVNQTFKGKVIFIAGASKGIDREIATTYAEAGTLIVITGPIKITVEKFGKLDIYIANTGAIESFDKLIAEQDTEVWWGILEVNIRGVHDLAHYISQLDAWWMYRETFALILT